MTRLHFSAATLAALTTLTLFGCGGGGTPSGNPTPTPVPSPTPTPVPLQLTGRMTYDTSDGFVWLMNADGANPVNLSPTQRDYSPVLSPDGTKILFLFNGNGLRLYLMDPDGQNRRPVFANDTPNITSITEISWSQDGQKIVFVGEKRVVDVGVDTTIYTVDIDGGNLKSIYTVPANQNQSIRQTALSPDGTKFGFILNGRLNVINADGSGLKTILKETILGTFAWSMDSKGFVCCGDSIFYVNEDESNRKILASLQGSNPVFSPDGTKIAFSLLESRDSRNIYVMNLDGSNRTKITNSSGLKVIQSWR